MKSFYSLLIVLLTSFISFNYAFAQSNQYLHFDGEDDFVVLENGSQYVEGAEGVSMTGWFYTDELTYGQGFFGLRGPGTGEGEMYIIELGDGVLECRYISSGGFHEFVGPGGIW